MRRRGRGGLAVLGVCLSLGLSLPGLADGRVRAAEHSAFWLWSGVTPSAALARAERIYLLRGQIDPLPGGRAGSRMIAQGLAMPRLQGSQARLWLVYRVHTLDWSPHTWRTLQAQLVRWQRSGNPLAGVQIDFDAQTRSLHRYADFLQQVRQRLPAGCQLSITGLLDWSSQGDPAALNRLGGVVDELVIQTYQGRQTVADYQRYLPSLGRLQLPFRVGLIEGGRWRAPPALASNPWFRGYVVFLQNPPGLL